MSRAAFLPVVLVSALLLAAAPASAQSFGLDNAADARTLVIFTAHTMMASGQDNASSQLPVDLMQRLSAQPSLAKLEVEAAGTAQVRMRAQFVFEGMDAFRQWYEAGATRRLMREINEAAPAELRTAVRLRRYPHTRFLDDEN